MKLQTPKQSAAFKIDHNFSDTNFDTAALHIDFAENYPTFYQDEVQSIHLVKSQIPIFTAALWQKTSATQLQYLMMFPTPNNVFSFLLKKSFKVC